MYGNPYFAQQQRFQQPMINQPTQPQPYIQPIIQQQTLLGKVVDNIEVVRAIDIPLDGSTSFFPLADNSAIITKQLQTDGTSKMVVYKPVQEDKKDAIKFATLEDIQNLKDDIDEMKKQLKEFKTKKSKDE